MRFEIKLLLVCVGASLFLLAGCKPSVNPNSKKGEREYSDLDRPMVTKDGPQPKLVIEKPVHLFGAMMVGEVKQHTFVIHNKGEATLSLKIGAPSCGKCSKFTLSKTEVAPGETAEVIAEWFPLRLEDHFRKFAPLFSNDADHRETQIVVEGNVKQVLELDRGTHWEVEEFHEGAISSVAGRVYSSVVEEFKILDLELDSDLLTAKATAMSEKELKELNAKSGYNIVATVSPNIPVGRFSGTMLLKTNIADLNPKTKERKERTDFRIYINCMRGGPFRIFSKPGTKWVTEAMVIDMSQFPASKGATAGLSIFINKLDGKEIKFEQPEAELDFVKVTIARDESIKSKSRQRFVLNVEIPPNSPVINRSKKKAMKVKIKTNHPAVPEFNFRISFLSI